MSEASSGVTCAGTNQAFATVVVQALNSWNGFHILEASSGAHAAFLWPVSVEGHPEVAHVEGLAEGFCFVGRGSSDVFVGRGGWNPIEVLPNTFERFDFHWTIEFGLKESVIGVLEGVIVFYEVSCSEAFEHILHSLHLEGGTNISAQK